jgi:putative ABC transport system ATP-binding protein
MIQSKIRLKGIEKIYVMGLVEVVALKGIDLSVEEHEFVCVMGASGSGKSTLMNIIGCLDRPTNGIYELEGKDVSKLNDHELAEIRNKRVGFVFQTFNLLPRINSLRNVELPLVYARVSMEERHKRAEEALRRVELADRSLHKPNELSGGQRQRVAIARALVNNPSIIFADEPTGNLDSRTGLQIMALFQKLHREGATIIMVTHEMDISVHATRIIHLKDGRIVGDEKIKKPKDAEKELSEIADLDHDELSDAIKKHN